MAAMGKGCGKWGGGGGHRPPGPRPPGFAPRPGGPHPMWPPGPVLAPQAAAAAPLVPEHAGGPLHSGSLSRWRYQPENNLDIHVREGPDVNANQTALLMKAGEEFLVSEEVHRGNVVYLRLADGRGWLFDKKLQFGNKFLTMCVRMRDEGEATAAGGAETVTPPAKRGKRGGAAPTLRVTKEQGPGEDVAGLELLLGTYSQSGDCAGFPFYEKIDATEGPCFLYYWKGDEPDTEDEGWWFGDEVGGSMVYCFSRARCFPPPEQGWHVPTDGDPLIECLRVRLDGNAQEASSPAGPPRAPHTVTLARPQLAQPATAGPQQPAPPHGPPPGRQQMQQPRPPGQQPAQAAAPGRPPRAAPPPGSASATAAELKTLRESSPLQKMQPPPGLVRPGAQQPRPPPHGAAANGGAAAGPATAVPAGAAEDEHVLTFDFTELGELGIHVSTSNTATEWPPIVEAVKPNSQAERLGLPTGWFIKKIGNWTVPLAETPGTRNYIPTALRPRPLRLVVQRPPEEAGGGGADAAAAGAPAWGRAAARSAPAAPAAPAGAPTPPAGAPPGAGGMLTPRKPATAFTRPVFAPTAPAEPPPEEKEPPPEEPAASRQPSGNTWMRPAGARPPLRPQGFARTDPGRPPASAGASASAAHSQAPAEPSGGAGGPRDLPALVGALSPEESGVIRSIVLEVLREKSRGDDRPCWRQLAEIASGCIPGKGGLGGRR